MLTTVLLAENIVELRSKRETISVGPKASIYIGCWRYFCKEPTSNARTRLLSLPNRSHSAVSRSKLPIVGPFRINTMMDFHRTQLHVAECLGHRPKTIRVQLAIQCLENVTNTPIPFPEDEVGRRQGLPCQLGAPVT
jgi:hypothetical protein